MNRALDPALFPPDRASTLRCGRAPVQWARDLSSLTQRLAMMRRACGWVGELAAARPQLCAQPLLGRCLTELTGEELRPPSVVAGRPLGGPKRFAEPGPKSKGNPQDAAARAPCPPPFAPGPPPSGRVSAPAREPKLRLPNTRSIAGRPQPAHQSGVARGLQPQAAGSLLRRLAGPPDDAPGGGDVSLEAIQVSRRSPHVPAPPSFGERAERRNWRDLMARRAAESLLLGWTGTARATSSESSDWERQFLSLALTEQWLTRLGGTEAPADTLAQLADTARSRGPGPGRETERAEPRSQIIPRPSPIPSEFSGRPEAATSRGQAFAGPPLPNFAPRHLENIGPPEPPWGFKRDDAPAPGQTADTTFPPAADSWRPTHSREDVWLSPTNIAPPTLTPSLPPLRPPRASEAAALPVAAATARQGAGQEEVIAQEQDLSLLEAQLKRILDDEARRHGIDV